MVGGRRCWHIFLLEFIFYWFNKFTQEFPWTILSWRKACLGGGWWFFEGKFSVRFGPKLRSRLWILIWTKLNKKAINIILINVPINMGSWIKTTILNLFTFFFVERSSSILMKNSDCLPIFWKVEVVFHCVQKLRLFFNMLKSWFGLPFLNPFKVFIFYIRKIISTSIL